MNPCTGTEPLRKEVNSKNPNLGGEFLEDKRLRFQKGKQKEMLEFLAEKHGLSHKSIATILGLVRKTVSDYFNEKNNILLSKFVRLVAFEPELRQFEVFVEEKLPLNWGASQGGFATAKIIEDKHSHYAKMREIKLQKELEDARTRKLTIFTHPIIAKMKREGVDLKAVFAVCLLTDGSMHVKGRHYRIGYATNDKILESIIFSLENVLSVKVPTIGYAKKANNIRVSDEELGKELLRLSPSFKTSPSWYETSEEYLNSPQPTLKFLFDASEQTKIWAMRFGFTADGSISVPLKSYPSLDLACYHPTLAVEWKDFMQSLGFKVKIVNSGNSWCGIAGIRAQTREAFKKFFDLGGFIDGVKISRKSKRYFGIPKNELLARVVNGGHGRNRTSD